MRVTPAGTPHVRLEVADHVALLTLDRPDVRNAITPGIIGEIATLVTACEAREDVRAMVLTGADPAFCAGVDLKALGDEARDAPTGPDAYATRFRAFPPHRKPIIGAVNGAAVTGGLELALGCDFLIASERARFADTHGRVGVMPGMGMTVRLPQLIGIDRARFMSLAGDFVDARRAYEWGLVVEVVPHEQLLDRAREIGRHIAGLPERNVAELRDIYDHVSAHLGEDAWEAESARSRTWMAREFDQARLRAVRGDIIERGRSQQGGPR